MTSLVLFVGRVVDCQRVDSLSDASEMAECVSLASCSSICLLRGIAEKTALSGQDVVVLDSGEEDIVSGRNGVVCWSYQSMHAVETLLRSDSTCEAIVSNIEGVLDDGLVLGKDFLVNAALPVGKLSGPDRVFLASANNSADGFWCYRIGLDGNAVLRLLDSATMGYLLGVTITSSNGSVSCRLVRCAGYDDSETDLLLVSADVVMPSVGILAAF